MFEKAKVGAGLWIFAGCLDRFCPSYSDSLDTDEQIKAAAKVKGLQGLELIYPWHFEGKSLAELKRQIDDSGLEIASVNPNIWADRKFKFGSFKICFFPLATFLTTSIAPISMALISWSFCCLMTLAYLPSSKGISAPQAIK